MKQDCSSRWISIRNGGMQTLGILFCLIWAYALLLFPLYKHSPVACLPTLLGLALACLLLRPRILTPLNRYIESIPSKKFWFCLLAAALLLRLLTLLIWPATPGSDSANYHRLALALCRDEGYGPSANWPPGLPLLLSLWYRITSPHPVSGYLLSALLSAASIPLLYDFARRAFPPLTARWAAILAAFMPTYIFTAARTDATSLLVFLILAASDLTIITLQNNPRGWLAALLLGAVLGFGSLVKPVFLLTPAIVLLSWLALPRPPRLVLRFLLCLAVMAAVIAPWTLRNYRLFHSLVLVSTNGGIVLYSGVNPDTHGMYSPQRDPHIHPLPGETDELTQSRLCRQAAVRWIRENPFPFLKLILVKQVFLWGTSSTNIAVALHPSIPPSVRSVLELAIKTLINTVWASLFLLVACATLRLPVWKNPLLAPLLLFLLYHLALHAFYEVQSRYHIPVISALLILAASALASPKSTVNATSL